MLKYYKNLITFISMFSEGEKLQGNSIESQKTELKKLVDEINLTKEQLDEINNKRRELNADVLENLQSWRNLEYIRINALGDHEDINEYKQNYKKLQDEYNKSTKKVESDSIEKITELQKEIPLIKAKNRKIKYPVPEKIDSDTTNATPKSSEFKAPINTNNLPIHFNKLSKSWVKEALEGHFDDINNPTKKRNIESFKGI